MGCQSSGMCSFGRCYCRSGYCLDAAKDMCLRTSAGGEIQSLALPAETKADSPKADVADKLPTAAIATEQCTSQTAGSCRFFSCHASRGPTNCVAHKCVCKPGLCNIDSKCQCARSGMCSFGKCYCRAGYCLDANKNICLKTVGASSDMMVMPALKYQIGEELLESGEIEKSSEVGASQIALAALSGGFFGALLTVAFVKMTSRSKNMKNVPLLG